MYRAKASWAFKLNDIELYYCLIKVKFVFNKIKDRPTKRSLHSLLILKFARLSNRVTRAHIMNVRR